MNICGQKSIGVSNLLIARRFRNGGQSYFRLLSPIRYSNRVKTSSIAKWWLSKSEKETFSILVHHNLDRAVENSWNEKKSALHPTDASSIVPQFSAIHSSA